MRLNKESWAVRIAFILLFLLLTPAFVELYWKLRLTVGWPEFSAASSAAEVKEFRWPNITLTSGWTRGTFPPLKIGVYAVVTFPKTVTIESDFECDACTNQLVVRGLKCETRAMTMDSIVDTAGRCSLHIWDYTDSMRECFLDAAQIRPVRADPRGARALETKTLSLQARLNDHFVGA
jgi:hypothetical protein